MVRPRLSASCRGFTLIEMLIVFALFGLMGVMASQIVTRVLASHETLSDRGNRLAEVQRAMQIIQRDIVQLNGRGIRDQLGDPAGPLLIGSGRLMEFTRSGWRNPLALSRAELQRVGYVRVDGALKRAYWAVLDRDADSEPLLQELLRDVDEIAFFALDISGNEHSFWPLDGDLRTKPEHGLAAILLRIELSPFGIVERIWPVPSL